MSICQEEYRRPSSIASYVSTPEQHLAAQVQVYPKGRKIPPDVEKGERRGFIICTSKVKDAMESYITRRAEHTTDKAYYTLKEDLITMAKQKAFDLDANAIIHAKLSIKKEWKYGRWCKLAGYLHGTAISFTPNSQSATPGSLTPNQMTPLEEDIVIEEEVGKENTKNVTIVENIDDENSRNVVIIEENENEKQEESSDLNDIDNDEIENSS